MNKHLLLSLLTLIYKCMYVELLTVSVFYPNFINDWGWTYRHEISRSNAADKLFDLGHKIDFVLHSNTSYSEATTIALEEAATGVDLIILSSAIYYEETIVELHNNYPNLPVISLTGVQTPSSVNLFPRSYQGYYLAGVYCAKITKTNNIAHFGINPILPTVNEVNAFTIGALSVNPEIQVKYGFMDNFYDPLLERNAARKIVNEWNIDCAISQSFDANTIWNNAGVTVIGYISDMRYLVGENVHFSVMYDWTDSYFSLLIDAITKNFTGGRLIYEGLGKMMKLSSFSPLVSSNLRSLVSNLSSSNLDNSIFCPPYYDRCLSDYEIIFMKNILPQAINPSNFTSSDFYIDISVNYESASGIVILTLTSLGLAICIGFIVLVCINRNTKTIYAASPIFCYFVLIGCACGLISNIFWLGLLSTVSCQFQIWLGSTAYSLALGSLVVKNFRIMILHSELSLRMIRISNSDLLLKGILPLLLLEFLYLSIWTGLDIYFPRIITDSPLLVENERFIICASLEDWGFSIFLSLKALLLVAGVVISYRVRKIKLSDYNESNVIGLIIYNITLIFVIAVVILLVVPFSVTIVTTVINIAIIIICYTIMFVLFLPKFIRIYKRGDKSSESFNSSGSSRLSSVIITKATQSYSEPKSDKSDNNQAEVENSDK